MLRVRRDAMCGPLGGRKVLMLCVQPRVQLMIGRPPVLGASAIDVAFLEHEIFTRQTYLQNGVRIRPGDTVLDVGANIGFFTLQASQLAGPRGHVIRHGSVVAMPT